MNDKINKLMILGERDIRAFDVAQSLRRIPGRIEEARRQLEFEEQQLAEVKDPWELLEREIQEREATIKIAQETIEKFEEHMKNVTNQKEYIAARKQVDEARRLNTRLQDEILERRVSQEELTPSLEERTQRHNKVSEGFEEERKVIDQERSELEKEFAGLEKEIGEILSDLGGDFLARYQRLIKGGRAPAVVPVVSGSCKGCRMSLPPQAYNLMLARVDDLHTCPTCTRFIYIKPEQEQEGEEQASGVAAG